MFHVAGQRGRDPHLDPDFVGCNIRLHGGALLHFRLWGIVTQSIKQIRTNHTGYVITSTPWTRQRRCFKFFSLSCFSFSKVCIDAIFICFCEDCEMNDGLERPYFMSRSLMVNDIKVNHLRVIIELKMLFNHNIYNYIN